MGSQTRYFPHPKKHLIFLGVNKIFPWRAIFQGTGFVWPGLYSESPFGNQKQLQFI